METKPAFVHLHNHSEYSLLDGTIRFTSHNGEPSELLKTLAHQHPPALALTDHGNLFGALEFYARCTQVGIKPIIGCEIYWARRSRLDRAGSQKDNCHLTLLAKNLEGYQNLMLLVSKAYLEGFYYDPRIDVEILRAHSKGLIALSGCLKSELAQAALSGNLQAATQMAVAYAEFLEPQSFYLEIMDHGLEKQKQVLKAYLEISRQTKIPLVATNDCHYFKKADHEAQDARVCIATGKKLSDTNRLRFESHEFYFKSPEEMAKLFSYAPEALANTVRIAEMCNLKIPMDQLYLPHYEVPEGTTADSYLEKLCREGLVSRLGILSLSYEHRLKEELSIIQRMGFSSYFLIVWDFIRFAKREGIPVGPGRGSGAGSLVAYALGITNVDPMEHKLLFERFLNPDRRSMPDLDIDFSDTGRERVIEYVRNKYGSGNVAQIITFGSMAARAAIRDVGRVLDIPLKDVDRLAKLIPPGDTLYKAIQKTPEIQEEAKNPEIKKLLDLAQKLEGLKRHTSVHAAGIVITKEAVTRYTPLSKSASSGVVTTQYDGDGLQRLGLLKIDFLGLRTLTVIAQAVENIHRLREPRLDIEKIPFDDSKTFELLRAARVTGVFQLESQGMRELLRKLKPTDFRDVVALIALYRPGPMQSGMLDEFVARKHGLKKVVFEHSLLEPILRDTYGVLVFQEQVMEAAKRLSGFTPGQADVLRKAMGKKDKELAEQERARFVEGARKNNIPPKLANKIFDQMVQFGGYGFNLSHATAYGVLAYQTAYLKANYPVEFMTAALSNEIGHNAIGAEDRENKLEVYLEETKSMGISILPPDVQKSDSLFAIEGENSIRYSLLAIKNVGTGAVETILQARRADPFPSLDLFCQRIDLRQANRKVLESLIKAGALDTLMPEMKPALSRARMLSRLEEVIERQGRIREDLQIGQGFLFEPSQAQSQGPAEPVQPLHEHDLLKLEREVLGLYLSGHPLLKYKSYLKVVATHKIEDLRPDSTGPIRLAGLLSGVKKLTTKDKGEPWARAILEDLTGEIRLLVFPKSFASGLGKQLKPNSIITVSGRLSSKTDGEFSTIELIVEEIQPIDLAISRWARKLTLSFSTAALEDSLLKDLRSLLSKHPGRCPVFLRLKTLHHGTALLETRDYVTPSQELFRELERTLGEGAWQIESAPAVETLKKL